MIQACGFTCRRCAGAYSLIVALGIVGGLAWVIWQAR
jgi:hypothetical protein